MESNPFDDPQTKAVAASVAAPIVHAAAKNPDVQRAIIGAVVSSYTKPSPPPPPRRPPAGPSNAYDDASGSKARAPENSGIAYGQAWSQDPEQQVAADRYRSTGVPEEEKTFCSVLSAGFATCSTKMPLRYCLLLLGALFVTAGILDFALNFNSALDLLVNVYLIVFGLLAIFLESPRMVWNRRVQEGMHYWAYFLARLWGRAGLYFFLSIFCLTDSESAIKICVGVYCILCVIVMYFVGLSGAKKMNRINVFVGKGAEGEQRMELIRMKFDELDTAKMGYLTANELTTVATQADRDLSWSERETLSRYFNSNFENEITLDEWVEGFEIANKGLRSL